MTERLLNLFLREEQRLKDIVCSYGRAKSLEVNQEFFDAYEGFFAVVVNKISELSQQSNGLEKSSSSLAMENLFKLNLNDDYLIRFLKVFKGSLRVNLDEDKEFLEKADLFLLWKVFDDVEEVLCTKIRSKQERYRMYIESSIDAMCSFDGIGKILDANHTTTAFTGYSAEELKQLNLVDLVYQTDRVKFYQEFIRLHDENRISVELKILRKNGTIFEGEISVNNVGENEFVAFCRDITEKKLAAENMVKTQELLRETEKLATIGKMAAGMAHEIRNPLTAVKGFAQIIKSKYSHDLKLVAYADVILNEMERVNELISDFLQLSRPKELIKKPEAMGAIISEILYMVNSLALLKEIEIVYEVAKDLPRCNVDRSRIKQVLLNMLHNSLEAMDIGGNIYIRVKYLKEEGILLIQVEDTGHGMSPRVLDQLGKPFFSTKENGTGLGLSISYSIIKAHDGWVQVNSKEGVGTLFNIYLPCR